MSHSLGIRGREGRLKVGYQVVATLGAFSLSPVSPGEWSFDASVTSADAFWLTQDGTRTLEILVGTQRWIWRNADRLVVDGGAVRGTVAGRPERR
jgi:hypothetical protein